MLSHMGLKIVVLSISLLGMTGSALACAAHEEKANRQTNVALATGTEAQVAESNAPSSPDPSPIITAKPEVKPETAVVSSSPAPKANPTVIANPNAKIQVLEFVLTNQIVNREPKDIVESYPADNRVAYAFARLNSTENAQVTFLWFQGDKEHRRFTTNVQPVNKWRTNASIKVKPGQWKVQLLADGQVLAERAFTVQ